MLLCEWSGGAQPAELNGGTAGKDTNLGCWMDHQRVSVDALERRGDGMDPFLRYGVATLSVSFLQSRHSQDTGKARCFPSLQSRISQTEEILGVCVFDVRLNG